MPAQMLEVRIGDKLKLVCPPLNSVVIDTASQNVAPRAQKFLPPAAMIDTLVQIAADDELIDLHTVKVGDAVVVGYPNQTALCAVKVIGIQKTGLNRIEIRANARYPFSVRQNRTELKLPVPFGFSAVFGRDKTALSVEYRKFEIDLQDYWLGRSVVLHRPAARGAPATDFRGYISGIVAHILKADHDYLRLTLTES